MFKEITTKGHPSTVPMARDAPWCASVRTLSAEFKWWPVTEIIQRIHDMVVSSYRWSERHWQFSRNLPGEGLCYHQRWSGFEEGFSLLGLQDFQLLKSTENSMSHETLDTRENDPDKFLQQFGTMDETWLHQNSRNVSSPPLKTITS